MTTRRSWVAPLALALVLGMGACAGTLDEPERFAGSCPPVETAILRPRCATAGCHAESRPAAGLDLESPGVLERLTDRVAAGEDEVLVVRGDPDASSLFTKLTSSPPFGARMPLGEVLDNQSINCIRAWIASAP